ncbi:hypothetical protein EJB05_26564, partial [Eragrostis curvula]
MMSRCALETVQGTHVFEIAGYSLLRGLGVGNCVESSTFSVGGYYWYVALDMNSLWSRKIQNHRRDTSLRSKHCNDQVSSRKVSWIAVVTSIQIILFYVLLRLLVPMYCHAVGARSGGDDEQPSSSARQQQQWEEDTDVSPMLLETPFADSGVQVFLAKPCFPLVFMVFVPLVTVVFERSQADVVAYALCLLNIIVMVIWLSPAPGAPSPPPSSSSAQR